MMPAPAATDGPLLRDIHMPPSPPWWPPAPGWWLLAAVALLLSAVVAVLWHRAIRARQRRARVLSDVDALAARHASDPQALAAGLHQLLRRVARTRDPAAARLRGEAWREALAVVPVDADTLARLLQLEPAIYRRQAYDRDAMIDAVRCWLRISLARPRAGARRA